MKTNFIRGSGILLFTLALAQPGRALAGGTVNFGNDNSQRLTNGPAASPVLLAHNIKAALYWSPAGAGTFLQIGDPVTVGDPLPGIFAAGTRTTGAGTDGGEAGDFQVRAWGGGYATYEQAAVVPGILIGQSAVVQVVTGNPGGDPPTPPASLMAAGFSGFELSPNAGGTPLQLICAAGKTVACGTAWTFDPPTPQYGCDNVVVSELTTITNGLCPQIITRTWQAYDDCGTTNECSQTVTVTDTTSPVLTCADNKTVECGSEWTFDAPTVEDACNGDPVNLTVLSTITNGSCPQIVTRVWQATDACGNTSTCQQIVTVTDTTPPTLTCVSDKSVLCSEAWSFDAPMGSDGCGSVIVTEFNTVTNGVCPVIITRTWLATDACGNTNLCSQVITVTDPTVLSVVCPADKTVFCADAWDFDPPTTGGGCLSSNASVTVLNTVTNSLCPLSLTRSWEISGVCEANAVTCQQTILVICPDCPSLVLTKECPPHPVPPGGLLNYAGTVTNLSELTLTNVIVRNDQPVAGTVIFGPATLAPGAGAIFAGSYAVGACDCDPKMDTLTATGVTPGGLIATNTLTTVCAGTNHVTPGDTNGDGVVDQAELNAVLANYWANSQWLYMTNPVALGGGNFQFALTNAGAWQFTVLVTTNFTDWTNLPGAAYPVYQFEDPEAPGAPQRYYRLQWP